MERPFRRLSFFGALGVILVALLSGEAVRRLGSLSRLTDDGNLLSCLYTLQLFLFQNGILLQVVAIEDKLDKDMVLSLELAEQADQSAHIRAWSSLDFCSIAGSYSSLMNI